MSAKPLREKVISFSFSSKMPDVGAFSGRFVLKRRTATIEANILGGKARMLGGVRAANNRDDLFFETIAILMNGVEKVGSEGDHEWVDDILDPAIWYALANEWHDFQDSFSRAADEASTKGAEG